MKQFIRTLIVFICFCFFSNHTKAQQQYILQQLLKHAVEHNGEIKKAALIQSGSKYKVKEVIANGLPQIEGSLNYSRMGIPEIDIPSEILGDLPEELTSLLEQLKNINALHTASADVTVSQLIYSQPYLSGIKQARKAEEMSATLYKKTEDEIIYDVASNYYNILMSYSSLKVLNENIQNLEKLYAILQLQYENDFIKQTDVSRLKVRLSNLKTQSETLRNAISIQKRILKIISGIPIEQEIELDPTIVDTENNKEPLINNFILEILPDFQLIQQQKELANLQVQSDKAAYYPNLAAFGQFSYSSYNTKFKFKDFNNMNIIGLKATIPIFSSGIRKYKIKQSQLEVHQIEEDFDFAKKRLGTAYQNAVNSRISAWKNLQDQAENKQLAHEVYKQVKLQFDEGMASLTDLLNVEASLLEAENLYNQQQLKYQLTEIDLLKMTGSLKSLLNN